MLLITAAAMPGYSIKPCIQLGVTTHWGLQPHLDPPLMLIHTYVS